LRIPLRILPGHNASHAIIRSRINETDFPFPFFPFRPGENKQEKEQAGKNNQWDETEREKQGLPLALPSSSPCSSAPPLAAGKNSLKNRPMR
jgi:hypothetical protein